MYQLILILVARLLLYIADLPAFTQLKR